MSNKIELRGIVTDALIGMISAVVEMSPPAGAPIPPFIQSAIDRAVERIASAIAQQPTAAAPAAPVAQEPAAWPAAAHNLVRDWQTGMASSNEVCIALASALCGTPPAAEQPECGCCGQTGPCDPDCDCAEQPDTVAVPRDVLRACRESLADGLETVGSAEAEWSTKDRALVARIDALLAGGAE